MGLPEGAGLSHSTVEVDCCAKYTVMPGAAYRHLKSKLILKMWETKDRFDQFFKKTRVQTKLFCEKSLKWLCSLMISF